MMKTIRAILLFLLLSCAGTSSAQHLTITNVIGVPDSAYEAVTTYPVQISIMNTGTLMFSDSIDVFIKANFHSPDLLYTAQGATTLAPQASDSLVSPGYHFDPAFFDEGDNIVVIWPAARNVPVAIDSLVDTVYFTSLNSVEESNRNSIKIFPNPATDFLYLHKADNLRLNRVRIYDSTGRTVFEGMPEKELIYIKQLHAGTYFVSVENSDGSRQVICLIKR